MSIRISEGGRLFGILAGLGGAAMVGGAGLPWALVKVGFGIPVHEYSVPRGIASADGRAVLVLGLLVMAGTACFTALGSKRLRIGAGALVVPAAAAGLLIAFPADPPSFAGRSFPAEVPCHDSFLPGPCPLDVDAGSGLTLARFGAILAAGAGIVALLRSGEHALPSPPAGYGVPSGAGRSEAPTTLEPPTSGAELTGQTVVDFGTRHKRRMSDASLLGRILVALIMALFFLAIALTVIASIIVRSPGSGADGPRRLARQVDRRDAGRRPRGYWRCGRAHHRVRAAWALLPLPP